MEMERKKEEKEDEFSKRCENEEEAPIRRPGLLHKLLDEGQVTLPTTLFVPPLDRFPNAF